VSSTRISPVLETQSVQELGQILLFQSDRYEPHNTQALDLFVVLHGCQSTMDSAEQQAPYYVLLATLKTPTTECSQ